jgi:hypothetical protein
MDCKALKPESRVEVMPNMPKTNLPNTVIAKPGKAHGLETTPTTGEIK